MLKFISRVTFCVATELVALAITDFVVKTLKDEPETVKQ